MSTIAQVFKMFPFQLRSEYIWDTRVKQKSKTISSCFSEGIQEGFMAFNVEMAYKVRNIKG
jgi:hypothetical protein